MDVQMMDIKDIHPYGKNPRRNDDAVQSVANSIRDFGFKQPIVVDREHIIIVGHTRYKAAKKLKLKQVPVLVADDLTEEQAKAYRIADNSAGSASTWDYDLLMGELQGISLDMRQYGIDTDDMQIETTEPPEVIDDEPPALPKEATTIMACEQLGRRCIMMELDPQYCDVIINRWETLTGKKAEKVVS